MKSLYMAKLYSNEKTQILNEPKKETIQFLLNYSKALHVNTFKQIEFETFLN